MYARSWLHQYSSALSILESPIGLSQACARQIIRVLAMVVVLHCCSFDMSTCTCCERKPALTSPFTMSFYNTLQHAMCILANMSYHNHFSCMKMWKNVSQCGFPQMHHICESVKTKRKAVQGVCANTCRVEEHLIDTTTTSNWDEHRLLNSS